MRVFFDFGDLENWNERDRWVVLRVKICRQREISLPPRTGNEATNKDTAPSIPAHQDNLSLTNLGYWWVRVDIPFFEEVLGGHEGYSDYCRGGDEST